MGVVHHSVTIFRDKKPDTHRTLLLPFMPVVPAFGVLARGIPDSRLRWETWLRIAIWWWSARPSTSTMAANTRS